MLSNEQPGPEFLVPTQTEKSGRWGEFQSVWCGGLKGRKPGKGRNLETGLPYFHATGAAFGLLMMKDRWIQAAIALGENPTLKIDCPNCAQSCLRVMDVYVPGALVFERYLRCESCGQYNAIRMTYEGPNASDC